MRSALPFVVLYDTEFILDTNAIDCYHKFDHQPLLGEATADARGQRRTFGFVRRLLTKTARYYGRFFFLI